MAAYNTYRVSTGRIAIHVTDYPGAEPPVLFLHGFTANGLASLRIGQLLSGRRRLLAPDLRGRGHSDMPGGEYGLVTHVNDMTALLDRLRIDRVVLAGHSFGATICVLMASALQRRVTGLMLFDGGAIPPEGAAAVLDAYYSSLQYRFASMDQYVERFRQSPLYQPWTDEIDALVRSNLFQQPDGSYIRRVPRYVVDADRRSETADAWQQLPTLYRMVTCPVLIVRAGMGVFGGNDQVLSDAVLRTMLDGMQQADAVTIEDAGHTSLLTMPSDKRDRAVLKFLGLTDDR